MEAREKVVDTLKRVFTAHAAVPMASLQLGLAPSDLPSDAATLLLPTGVRLVRGLP